QPYPHLSAARSTSAPRALPPFPTRRSSDLVDADVDGDSGRDPELERMAALLESSGDYRVIRRLRPPRQYARPPEGAEVLLGIYVDRKSTRLNSSHVKISYAVFCLKKKKKDR